MIFDKLCRSRLGRYQRSFRRMSDTDQKADLDFDIYAHIPGGVHCCCLSEPIHLVYYNDGLCRMLGYTRKEMEHRIGPKHRYSRLIYPEDRSSFITSVCRLAITEGHATCEYRLMCKNGSLLAVSDTMDTRRSASGVLYGCSVVTDVSRQQQQQQKLEQELSDTRQQLEETRIRNAHSQMQPHFLYNALASIREVVLDNPTHGSDLLYDFSTHLRACIRSMSNEGLVSFSQELTNIQAYVNIEKVRLGEKLHMEYECAETDFEIIPLGIQPLVENAIRHGIYERGSEGGTVTLRTLREEDRVLVCVEDNGVGFDFDAMMREVTTGGRDSHGLANLIFRFEKRMHAKVTVESRIGVGTRITVAIPTDSRQESQQEGNDENNRGG